MRDHPAVRITDGARTHVHHAAELKRVEKQVEVRFVKRFRLLLRSTTFMEPCIAAVSTVMSIV